MNAVKLCLVSLPALMLMPLHSGSDVFAASYSLETAVSRYTFFHDSVSKQFSVRSAERIDGEDIYRYDFDSNHDLFKITLWGSSRTQTNILPSQQQAESVVVIPQAHAITVRYDNLAIPSGGPFKVRLRFSVDENPENPSYGSLLMRIEVTRNETNFAVKEMEFPRLRVSSLPMIGTYAVMNTSPGLLLSKPFQSTEATVYPGQGRGTAATQVVGIGNRGADEFLYFGTRDSLAHTKIYQFEGTLSPPTAGFDITYVVPNNHLIRNLAGQPYFTELRPLKGDAYSAVDYYVESFAKDQFWTAQGKQHHWVDSEISDLAFMGFFENCDVWLNEPSCQNFGSSHVDYFQKMEKMRDAANAWRSATGIDRIESQAPVIFNSRFLKLASPTANFPFLDESWLNSLTLDPTFNISTLLTGLRSEKIYASYYWRPGHVETSIPEYQELQLNRFSARDSMGIPYGGTQEVQNLAFQEVRDLHVNKQLQLGQIGFSGGHDDMISGITAPGSGDYNPLLLARGFQLGHTPSWSSGILTYLLEKKEMFRQIQSQDSDFRGFNSSEYAQELAFAATDYLFSNYDGINVGSAGSDDKFLVPLLPKAYNGYSTFLPTNLLGPVQTGTDLNLAYFLIFRSFTFGLIPIVVASSQVPHIRNHPLNDLSISEPFFDTVETLIHLHWKFRDIIRKGEFLRPLKIKLKNSDRVSKAAINSQTSLFAAASPQLDGKIPKILNAVWRNEAGTEAAIVLMNWSNSSVKMRPSTIRRFDLKLGKGNYCIRQHTQMGTKILATIDGGFSLTAVVGRTVPARSFKFFTVKPCQFEMGTPPRSIKGH